MMVHVPMSDQSLQHYRTQCMIWMHPHLDIPQLETWRSSVQISLWLSSWLLCTPFLFRNFGGLHVPASDRLSPLGCQFCSLLLDLPAQRLQRDLDCSISGSHKPPSTSSGTYIDKVLRFPGHDSNPAGVFEPLLSSHELCQLSLNSAGMSTL